MWEKASCLLSKSFVLRLVDARADELERSSKVLLLWVSVVLLPLRVERTRRLLLSLIWRHLVNVATQRSTTSRWREPPSGASRRTTWHRIW